MSRIAYHVPEMHCEGCIAGIRRSLESVPGVRSVAADLHLRRVEVEYDEGLTDVVKIREAIERAGFDVG